MICVSADPLTIIQIGSSIISANAAICASSPYIPRFFMLSKYSPHVFNEELDPVEAEPCDPNFDDTPFGINCEHPATNSAIAIRLSRLPDELLRRRCRNRLERADCMAMVARVDVVRRRLVALRDRACRLSFAFFAATLGSSLMRMLWLPVSLRKERANAFFCIAVILRFSFRYKVCSATIVLSCGFSLRLCITYIIFLVRFLMGGCVCVCVSS